MATTQTDGIRISLSAAGPDGGIHVVRVDGRIDTLTSTELDEVFGALVRAGRFRVIVDLAGVRYISSAGWGVFISRLREAREGGGDIRLARMSPGVREVYDLLEFDGLLPTYERLEEAQAGFDGGKPVGSEPAPPTGLVATMSAGAGAADLPPPRETLEAAVLRLILEDPFYSVGEIKARLAETGDHRAGRWAIWQVLRRRKLLRPRQRFRYFRRHRAVSAYPS